jgi:hypothetical protein
LHLPWLIINRFLFRLLWRLGKVNLFYLFLVLFFYSILVDRKDLSLSLCSELQRLCGISIYVLSFPLHLYDFSIRWVSYLIKLHNVCDLGISLRLVGFGVKRRVESLWGNLLERPTVLIIEVLLFLPEISWLRRHLLSYHFEYWYIY